MRAWSEMFNTFLAEHRTGESSAARSTAADTSPYTDADYFAHVDGKPRYDGVRDFLTSRGIRLSEEMVRSLGDRKNAAFQEVLDRDGVAPYPGRSLSSTT